MILLKIQARIDQGKDTEFKQAVQYIIDSRLLNAGGSNHRLMHDINDDCLIDYSEEWKYKQELKSYLTGDSFKALIGAMKVLGDIQQARMIESDRVVDIIDDL